MEKGDVIPINFPDKIFLKAGGVPVFEGTFGESRGNLAIKIDQPVKRTKLPNDAATQALMAKTGVANG
jgi:flagellar motor switch protein FliM